MKTTMFKALADPTRLEITEILRNGPLTVGEITERLGIRQPQASKHLSKLSGAGIVEVNAVANRRIYKLRQEPFQELDVWLATYHHIWEERFDRLDDYLEELQRKKGNREDKS